MLCNSDVRSTSAFAHPPSCVRRREDFFAQFWPVRASSLCQVNTLAIAKTDKIKNSSALAVAEREKNPRRNISRSLMIDREFQLAETFSSGSFFKLAHYQAFGANRNRPGVRLPILAIGKDGRGGNIRSVEGETVVSAPERF
jgi:hypothetical protein